MDIGSVVRVWRAEPVTEPVPDVVASVGEPVPDRIEADDGPVPVDR